MKQTCLPIWILNTPPGVSKNAEFQKNVLQKIFSESFYTPAANFFIQSANPLPIWATTWTSSWAVVVGGGIPQIRQVWSQLCWQSCLNPVWQVNWEAERQRGQRPFRIELLKLCITHLMDDPLKLLNRTLSTLLKIYKNSPWERRSRPLYEQ